jgi:hypothetical protein
MMDDAPGCLLRKIITLLEAARIPHMVVGSFASTAHGEPRMTRDLDLVIDPRPDQLNELLAALDAEHYSMFNIIEIATAWKLDLMIRRAEHRASPRRMCDLPSAARNRCGSRDRERSNRYATATAGGLAA